MSEGWQRILQGLLFFAGIMLMMAPSYSILPSNISYFICVGCFVAIGVIEYYDRR